MKKTQVPMREQPPRERIKNFYEVPLGYSVEEAIEEAERCLQCKKPACVEGCPVGINIPKFINEIKERKFENAINTVKSKNSLPAICGRVCPQEEQCQELCVLGKKGEPVSIGRLERFIADWERAKGVNPPCKPKPIPKKIAVVGSGPAGLACAGELAKLGYKVTVFESLHLPGGVLSYGIPAFRLPKEIVSAEIEYIRKLGVEIRTNMVIGKTLTVPDLQRAFDALFIASGAGLPIFLGIPGENLNGIYSANEFLTRTNLMKAYRFPEYDTPIQVGAKVAVIGAGNVAMDAARCALRLGAKSSTIVYRRSEREMPARNEEIEHAKEEGVRFRLLTNPVRYIGNQGWVKQMECVRMRLGKPDGSGRRRPIVIKNSNFTIDVDTIIIAIGQKPNPLIPKTMHELKLGKRGNILVNREGKTSVEGIFAGGDIATGAATVISAMGMGKRAAKAIHKYLK